MITSIVLHAGIHCLLSPDQAGQLTVITSILPRVFERSVNGKVKATGQVALCSQSPFHDDCFDAACDAWEEEISPCERGQRLTFYDDAHGGHLSIRGWMLGDGIDPGIAEIGAFHESLRALSGAALRIGQDHVAATVNTLVLAYAGASLPMLLLFSVGSGNVLYLLNSATVAEETVRTLVGSLGLVAAVPISTFVAALLALHDHRLGRLRRWLGPETGRGEHHNLCSSIAVAEDGWCHS